LPAVERNAAYCDRDGEHDRDREQDHDLEHDREHDRDLLKNARPS
jgi:hypothetical protein